MGKRPRPSDGGPAELSNPIDEQDPPTKKARKETNASAQRTLFVRSLPAVATSEALTELFSESYPLKHATVVLDPETKQSKGYGFVTFADAEDAQRAQQEFHGQAFLGRKMNIEVAQPRSRISTKAEVPDGKEKSQVSEAAAAFKKAREEKMRDQKKPPKLIIRNLPWSVKTPEQLAELFRKFGKVKHSTLPKIKDDTQAGFGFVVMRGKKNAEKALASINGTLVDGRTVAVDWAVDKNVWETQNKAAETDEGNVSDEEDNAEGPIKKPLIELSNNPEDDVANFFENFGDGLESEPEDDDEDVYEESEDSEEEPDDAEKVIDEDMDDELEEDGYVDEDESAEESEEEEKPKKSFVTDNSTTLFIRNLPFTVLDPDLKEHFNQFGAVRYARVVMDRATDRPKGTGFVCFFNVEDADACYRGAPRGAPTGANAIKKGDAGSKVKHSVLENENSDKTGMYSIDGRVLQIAKAVDRDSATKLTVDGTSFRTDRDKDKRKLYLLSEGTVASGTPLYEMLAPSEIKMREDSAMQRKKLIQNNPTLHLSLTRLSIRNLPRNINSKDLKALAREAVVGFAKDVKEGKRAQLSKEEESRGGDDMKDAEKQRKTKGKGIVRQAKIVFEGREGVKVSEESGAGRSRGYGFVEYSSHRWALMGLRWLNGHALTSSAGKKQRLIVEFAIENAQVVQRRKENEEKARNRSKAVVEARARGELPEKEKVVAKSQLMAKTRKGMKGKPKGKFPLKEKPEKSFDRVVPKPRADQATEKKPMGKGGKSPFKKVTKVPTSKPDPVDPDGKVSKKGSIIQRKRLMRKLNRQGKS